jgi:hypothetical protein
MRDVGILAVTVFNVAPSQMRHSAVILPPESLSQAPSRGNRVRSERDRRRPGETDLCTLSGILGTSAEEATVYESALCVEPGTWDACHAEGRLSSHTACRPPPFVGYTYIEQVYLSANPTYEALL